MRLTRHVVYDYLHGATVTGLIGFTVISMGWLSYKAANYFLYKRPILYELKRKEMEEKVALEHSLRESELLEKKKSALN